MAAKPSPARRGALAILRDVLNRKKFASTQLDVYLKAHRLSSEDRGLLTQLVYGVLRSKGALDRIIFSKIRADSPEDLVQALRLGIYQLLFLEKIPDHAALFETVEEIKRRGGAKLSGVANAVLRELQREKDRFRAEVHGEAWIPTYYPPWLWERWARRYGLVKARALGVHFNQTPKLWGRVKAQSDGSQPFPFIPIPSGGYEEALERVKKGELSLQDPHSYQVVRELNPQNGERGLDACAGHGGKAVVIAEWLGEGVDLSVFDISQDKLQELKRNFKRLTLTIPKIIKEKHNILTNSFNWVLIDAPCSGLGTLGRKPEIRWKTEPNDLLRHSGEQLALLNEWAPFLKVGGRILYSVCSLEPEEGTEVLEKFLRLHPEWELTGQGVLWPGDLGEDGFFWGRLVRQK